MLLDLYLELVFRLVFIPLKNIGEFMKLQLEILIVSIKFEPLLLMAQYFHIFLLQKFL